MHRTVSISPESESSSSCLTSSIPCCIGESPLERCVSAGAVKAPALRATATDFVLASPTARTAADSAAPPRRMASCSSFEVE